MRIIAGRFRGRSLVSFKADHIRPTTDRIKESIFNKLQGDIDGERILDLFSGTGNLSCESISRGAREVVAVELSRKSIAIIRQNLELLDIEDEVQVVEQDVLKFLRGYMGEPFGLIFADPPFTEKMADRVLEAISGSKVLGEQTLVVIESSSHESIRDSYPALARQDERDYGDKRVTYWSSTRTVAEGE